MQKIKSNSKRCAIIVGHCTGMLSMIKNSLYIVLMVFLFTGCLEQSSGENQDNFNLEEGTTNVVPGTITGTPTPPSQLNLLNFHVVDKKEKFGFKEEDQGTESYCLKHINDVEMRDSEGHVPPASGRVSGPSLGTGSMTGASTADADLAEDADIVEILHVRTQKCYFSSDESDSSDKIRLGVVAMNLLEFKDSNEDYSIARPGEDEMVTLTQQVPWFSKQDTNQVVLTVDNEGMKFPLSLEPIEGEVQAGGLQIYYSFIDIQLPDNSNKVKAAHQGMFVRICATPDDVSEDVKEVSCGNPQAKFGDVLFKENPKKSNMSFFHEGEYVDDRPMVTHNVRQILLRIMIKTGNVEATEFDIENGLEGYYAPYMSFKEISQFAEDVNNVVSVGFDISQSVHFLDGALPQRGVSPVGFTPCLDEINGEACPGGSTDPDSVGVYDPEFDILLIDVPKPEIVVKEIQPKD
jgi:hypothetical protein